MRLHSLQALLFCTSCFLSVTSGCRADEPPVEPGAWKTAYYKRGFAGMYKAEWAGGVNSTIRMRIPLASAGSKVQVVLRSSNSTTELSRFTLARGRDDAGTITGETWPVTFAGQAGVSIAPKAADVMSDAVTVSLTPGTWYLQQSYTSPEFAYANDKDGYTSEAGDKHSAPTLERKSPGTWAGNVYRVDVWTTDTRPSIVCFGDSITQGFGATPGQATRYPEVLAKLVNRPTLNLGVNGDLITYTGGAPILIRSFNGVGTVVLLMGINDIINGQVTTAEKYAELANRVIGGIHGLGLKIYLGTLPPAGGYAKYDKDPAHEPLRQAINAWIRTEARPDGVIDFDKALADPENPVKMRAEYQSDWLHPNDAGYQKMAETAAGVLGK